ALGPGLLTQSSYGMLAGKEGDPTPGHAVTLCTFGAAVSSIGLAGLAILVLPWALPVVFGQSYRAGVLAGSLGLATAIVHMSAAPTAARLTIVSLRLTGVINAVWAVLVFLLAPLLIPRGGAVAATGIYLVSHMLSAVLVFVALARIEGLPQGLGAFALVTGISTAGLALLALLRQLHPEWALSLGTGIFLLIAVSLGAQVLIGFKNRWLPGAVLMRGL
ncbi:MAG: hypothetical protein QOJ99_1415, partial [Bryobacterales bacterium]|nr:hypothetical protein [Bryobacterales bacterium]